MVRIPASVIPSTTARVISRADDVRYLPPCWGFPDERVEHTRGPIRQQRQQHAAHAPRADDPGDMTC